jgi:hypothetical protein
MLSKFRKAPGAFIVYKTSTKVSGYGLHLANVFQCDVARRFL